MSLSITKQGLSIFGDVDDTPVDGATKKGVSSNWAYDHDADSDAHVGAKDLNGEELILDVDADSSITVDTDDQFDLKLGGSDILSITNDLTKTTIMGLSGDYWRIGDAGTTSRSLNSEDDLMVTGELEVDGAAYFDSTLALAGTMTFSSHLQSANTNRRLAAVGINDGYFYFQCHDTDGSDVEVARLQGAADPYFSLGGSQNIKGYYSGKFALVEQAAAGADIAGEGQFWVKNDTPNTPYFTDDAGTDHAIITGATATKHEFHIPFEDPTGQVGNWDVVAINAAQDTHFVLQVPENFEALVNAKVVMIPDTTETIQWDINVSVSAAGEAYNNDDRSAADQTLAVTADQLTEVDISGQLTGLTAGDYVAIDFLSDIADLRIIGFEFDYT